jgi:hypothetical protein
MTDSYNVQVVCFSIELIGETFLNMVYDDNLVYTAFMVINIEE